MNFRQRSRLFAFVFFGTSIAGLVHASAMPSPRPYCANVVNDDRLHAVPSSLGPIVARLFNVSGAYASQTTSYRCADGKVMLCNVGANLPCGKANLSKSLPGATAWCKDNPKSDFIPMAATGHDTIYNWHCANGIAVAGAPVSKVDARGFFIDNWKTLP
ncbi:MAG: hypothetical protein AB1508_09330 [Pseudomonadota bacterium]